MTNPRRIPNELKESGNRRHGITVIPPRMFSGMCFMAVVVVALLAAPSPCHGLAGPVQQKRKLRQRSAAARPPTPSRWEGHRETTATVSTTTTTTETPVDSDSKEVSLEVLWGMAGKKGRKKRQRTSGSGNGNGNSRMMEASSFAANPSVSVGAGKYNSKKKRPSLLEEEGTIPSNEIASLEWILPSDSSEEDLCAQVRLVNGTEFTVNPKELHQREDKSIWLGLRSKLNVTASEVSGILGNSIFTDREALIQKKVLCGTKDAKDTIKVGVGNWKACEWGLRMEPQALRQYIQATGNTVEETGLHVGILRLKSSANDGNDNDDDQSIWIGASPDGLIIDCKDGSKGVLEIKSLWGRRHKRELPQFDRCPGRFMDQIQTQMAICNVDWCDLILYIPPTLKTRSRRNYCILRIERDPRYWDETVLPALSEFCRDVSLAKDQVFENDEGAEV